MFKTLPFVLMLFLSAGTASAVLSEEKTPETSAKPQTPIHPAEQTDLLLKDEDFDDAGLAEVLKPLPKIKNLTLRRMPNISAVPNIDSLRHLSLIELNITGKMFDSVLNLKDLTALDLRNCSGLTLEQYKQLNKLTKLRDLKIGGFIVNDDVLKIIAMLPNLTGLTLDDTSITAEGLTDYIAKSLSVSKLQMIVINKGILSDNDLLPLNKFPKLQRLTVSNSMITGEFLKKWTDDEATRPKLMRLSLRNTLFNEENAACLKKYPELKETDLSGTIVEATVETISK